MIVVKLMGGLGNQMFQYAFGRSLALKNNTELKLDLSFLEDKTHRENFTYRDYELNVFAIQANIASQKEISPFQKSRKRKIIDYLLLNLSIKPNNFYLKEPHFNYFAKALSAPKNTYAEGYWQSEKYFINCRAELLNEFFPKEKIVSENKSLADKIHTENAVSLHVRRGDYVSSAHNNNFHGTCDKGYYLKAIELITQKVDNPVFYVFSDEPQWFRENFNINFPVHVVEQNSGKNSYWDMYLMSQCKHHIIANSSFSWWGAWLNKNEDKIVVAPKNWFRDTSMNTQDLIPSNWIKI